MTGLCRKTVAENRKIRRENMYNEEDIRHLCTQDITYLRAQKVLAEGKVSRIRTEESEDGEEAFYIEANVEGSSGENYYVWLRFNLEEEAIEDYECECEAYRNYDGMCKHCGAVALKYLHQVRANTRMSSYRQSVQQTAKVHSDPQVLELVREYDMRRRQNAQEASGNIELEATLHENGWNYYYGRKSYTLTFTVGPADGKKYVLKNMDAFCEAVKEEKELAYGKKLAFVHCKSMFSVRGWEYVKLIRAANEMSAQRSGGQLKELLLNTVTLEQFLNLNLGREVNYTAVGYRYDTLKILDKNPPLKITLQELENVFRLVLPPLTLWKGNEHLFVRMGQTVYRCSNAYRIRMEKVLDYANADRETVLRVAKNDMMSFCSAVLPELDELGVLDKGKLSLKEYQPPKAEIAYYLDEENGKMTARAQCSYGETKIELTDRKAFEQEGAFRDRMRERRALGMLRGYYPFEDETMHQLFFDTADDARMYQLMDTGLAQLETEGKVYATDRVKAHKIVRAPKAQVGVSIKSDLLALDISSEAFSNEELSEILGAYQKKKTYYRLKNGELLNLKDSSVAALAELFAGLDLSEKKLLDGTIEVPLYSAYYVDSALKNQNGQLQVDRGESYRAMVREMKNVEDSDYQIPPQLLKILREYQKTGYCWLRTLAHLHFGGILADDMGLGKTLQTIAAMLARRQEGESTFPDLIICPTSLLYNWKKEFERFAPELSVCLVTGTATQREAILQQQKESGEAQVLITSYDMVKRDLAFYRDLQFSAEVIDEAQNIKNQGTAAAKAVKKIHAGVRFALTGTPIENRLGELWSIFDYLMPGYLGSYEKFRKNYEKPIMLENDETVTQRLKRKVTPFILRRLKQDVLKELPEKLEQVVYARMEGEQERLYQAHVQQLRESLETQSDEEVRKGKIQILAQLTRLRQICCNPALLYENYKENSCKVDACMELVRDAVDGKHKVLIFSQFTSLFPVLKQKLEAYEIPCYELTGSTPKEERQRLTEAFNEDDVPVFLISLKAGGTGLNLTAASVVIHFDPWWNVAAQNQATDRAHRIGQKNQVVVFRLIAQNTIEEKILHLQEKKQEMASQILSGEGISATAMTREELLEILAEE